jgi:CHAT domain-containing protein
MAKFYEFHLRGDPVVEEGPLPPARALRQAQRWLREVTASELADYYDAERRKPDHMRAVSYEQASQLFRRFASIEPPTTLPFRHPVYWARYTFNGI